VLDSGRNDSFLSFRAKSRGLYCKTAVEISPLHFVPVEMTDTGNNWESVNLEP